jgi:hypothetical protein
VCYPFPNSHFATRDHQNSYSIKLVETRGRRLGPFLAFSHCWGKEQRIRRTTETYPIHLKTIPYSSLPRTPRDAVRFSIGMGVRYLWIDSLCIIQDKTEDWAAEATRMVDIYESAHLVLAASSAKDGAAGFYRYPSKFHSILTGRNNDTLATPEDVMARRPFSHCGMDSDRKGLGFYLYNESKIILSGGAHERFKRRFIPPK